MKLKHTIILSLILFSLISFVVSQTSSSSINWLSRGAANYIYCQLGGDCAVHNLNATGNITGNQIYGEVWNYTSASYMFPIAGAGVYYNLTGLVMGTTNGFTFEDNTQALGGSQLVAQVEGTYRAAFSMSFSSAAQGGLYGFSINHDYNPNTHRNCYARREASGDTGSVSINCIMDLMVGEHIGIMIENELGTRNMNVQTVNLNVWRIGDIN